METRTAALVIVLVANRRDNIVHGIVVVGWKEGGGSFFLLYLYCEPPD